MRVTQCLDRMTQYNNHNHSIDIQSRLDIQSSHALQPDNESATMQGSCHHRGVRPGGIPGQGNLEMVHSMMMAFVAARDVQAFLWLSMAAATNILLNTHVLLAIKYL